MVLEVRIFLFLPLSLREFSPSCCLRDNNNRYLREKRSGQGGEKGCSWLQAFSWEELIFWELFALRKSRDTLSFLAGRSGGWALLLACTWDQRGMVKLQLLWEN